MPGRDFLHFECTLGLVDTVFVEGLLVYAHHGATDEEQAVGRPYSVDVWLEVDTRPAGQSDRLGDTVDYGRVSAIVHEVLTSHRSRLVEHVAERLSDRLLGSFASVVSVRVRIEKLSPPTGFLCDAAGVEITRTR